MSSPTTPTPDQLLEFEVKHELEREDHDKALTSFQLNAEEEAHESPFTWSSSMKLGMRYYYHKFCTASVK